MVLLDMAGCSSDALHIKTLLIITSSATNCMVIRRAEKGPNSLRHRRIKSALARPPPLLDDSSTVQGRHLRFE
jgi:hypothetical protein